MARRIRLAGAARGTGARRPGHRGAARAERRAAHPARARGVLPHRQADVGTCRTKPQTSLPYRRSRSRWCRAIARAAPAHRGALRGHAGAGADRRGARAARRLCARRRPAVDALRRLPPGLAVSRRRARARRAAREGHRRHAPARQAPAHLAACDAGGDRFDCLAEDVAEQVLDFLQRELAQWPAAEKSI